MVWFMNMFEFKPITRRVGDNSVGKWPKPHECWMGRDDEDYIRKTKIMTLYTTPLAAFMAVSDINLFPAKELSGVAHAISRIKFWAVPIIGAGISYTTVVNMSANLRKKNDVMNHFYAGLSVGAVFGKCSGHFLTGVLTGLGFGMFGLIGKDSILCGYDFFKEQVLPWRQYGTSMSHFHDWTTEPDRQGYWVRDKEKDGYDALWKRGIF